MQLTQYGMLGFPSRGTSYYVSETGTGDGLSESTPMSPADFLLLTLQTNDKVYFLADDEF